MRTVLQDRQTPWTIRTAQQWARDFLAGRHIPNPGLDAEILLRYALGVDRVTLLLSESRVLSGPPADRFRDWVLRRAQREPVSYILEIREFWGLSFRVTPDVLIPRPETELILETVLRLLDSRKRDSVPLRFLDLGTGSGCLAIALAREFGQAIVDSVDISSAALKAARENAVRHGVETRIRWFLGDLYDPLRSENRAEGQGEKVPYDLIVSNPPYISRREMEQLPPEVRNYEPAVALDGGEDGLDFYRRILEEVPSMLKQGGSVVVEVGMGQGTEVGEMIRRQPRMSLQEVCRDLAGIERVVVGIRR